MERLNPMVTWAIGKGGSVRGGATLQQTLLAGNDFGMYPAEKVGEYSASDRYQKDWRDQDTSASFRQVGFAMIPFEGEELAEKILLCNRKGFGVMFGNTLAVNRFERDSHGVYDATIGGGGAHATAFGGLQTVNGKDYLLYLNSHGNIYPKDDGTPAFGGWMSWEKLVRFCSTKYVDAAVILCAEAPYDDSVKPTLEV